MSTQQIQSIENTKALLVNTEIELKKAIFAFLSERQVKDIATIKLFDKNNPCGEALPIHKAYGQTALNGGIEIFDEGKIYMAYPPNLDKTPFFPNITITGDVVTMTVWYCTHNCMVLSDDLSDNELDEFYQEYGYYANDENGYDELGSFDIEADTKYTHFYFQPIEADLYIAPLNSDEVYNEKYNRMQVLYYQYYKLLSIIDEFNKEQLSDSMVLTEAYSEELLTVEVETPVVAKPNHQEA